VTLLAPSGPGAALLGTGAAGVAAVLPWESAAFAALFEEGGTGGAAADRIRGHDAAIAYTRDHVLSGPLLRRLVRHVAVHDPAPPEGGPHASRWLASPLPAVGIPLLEVEVPELAPAEPDARAADAIAARLPAGFLALHPGSGSRRKNWPAERFAELAGRERAPWLLVQGPADDAAAAVLATVPGAVVARDLPLRTLAALLARAGAYVGNDSGITHLAAAAGAPTVALFGATDPKLWAPIGPRVRIVDCGGAMDAVTVETVSAAVSDRRRG